MKQKLKTHHKIGLNCNHTSKTLYSCTPNVFQFLSLDCFSSERLSTLYEQYPKLNYALLIFEKPDSFVGRKIILDFSAYANKLIIRHVTPDVNPKLFEKFGVPKTTDPVIFVVVNGKDNVKRYQNLDKYVQKLQTEVAHNDGKL